VRGQRQEHARDPQQLGAGEDGQQHDDRRQVERLTVDPGHEEAVLELLIAMSSASAIRA
jgi:hypothetical protein